MIRSSALHVLSAAMMALVFAASCRAPAKRGDSAASAHVHVHGGPLGSVTFTANKLVVVTRGDASASVDLRALPSVTRQGEAFVPLAAVWAAAKLGPPDGLVLDFEGDDGYRPTTKPKCPKPLPAAHLDSGYISLATRTLVWDESLGLDRCYGVKLTRRIEATAP